MADRLVLVVMPDGMRVNVDDPAQVVQVHALGLAVVFSGIWAGVDEHDVDVTVNGRHVSRCWLTPLTRTYSQESPLRG